MKEDKEALDYFVKLMREGKIKYQDGVLWKYWEPRRGWLDKPKRAEKLTSNGYYILRTVVKQHKRSYYIMAHRVIWSYFNGDIPDGMEINHINGIKTDNRIENLELVTREKNRKHAFRNGLIIPAKGLRSGRGKLSDDEVREIRRLFATGKYTQKEIANMFGVRPNQISRICSGKRRGDVLQEVIKTFDDYQQLSKRTLNYSLDYRESLADYVLGIAGEAGEVVEIFKKGLFHGHELNKYRIIEELGDILFYIAAVCTIIGVNLNDVATYNVKKLQERYPDGFSEERSKERLEGG